MPSGLPLKWEFSFFLIQADVASRRGLIQTLDRYPTESLMTFKSKAIAAVLLLASTISLRVEARLLEQTLAVVRADGSSIDVMVSRPLGIKRVPIVLAVDGSLCIPSRLSEYMDRLSPESSGLAPYALVTVEKPEPSQPTMETDGSYSIGPEFQCSATFKKYYSIDQRVLDHLRAIQFLRRHADWWDGRIFVWGFSDGARIASRVAAFTPETQRVVLGGLGGGISMASEFEDFHICPKERTENRDKCIEDLKAQFNAMRENPTSSQTWSGDANTWRAWASRLDAVESNILKDVAVPVLVFHGSEDKSVPVASARLLAKQLSTPGGPPFEYREIAGMGHGLGSKLPDGEAAKLQQELLAWLLAPPGK